MCNLENARQVLFIMQLFIGRQRCTVPADGESLRRHLLLLYTHEPVNCTGCRPARVEPAGGGAVAGAGGAGAGAGGGGAVVE